ncbi:MAG: hypothetical protein Kow0026_26240 [Oricola sp.]
MDDKVWFYARNNEQKGPVDLAEIDMLVAAGVIGPDTPVWRDGMADWQPAAAALPESSKPNGWPDAPPPMRPQAPAPGGPAGSAPGAEPHAARDTDAARHPVEFMECVKYCFNHYARFRGRARRPEFWYFALFNFLVSLGLGVVDRLVLGFGDDVSPLNSLYSLAVLVPSIAVGARRLHDTGRSGWWQLILFIPLIGLIVLIIWWAGRGEERANEYGPA